MSHDIYCLYSKNSFRELFLLSIGNSFCTILNYQQDPVLILVSAYQILIVLLDRSFKFKVNIYCF